MLKSKKMRSALIALLINAQLQGTYHWAINRIDNQSDYFVEIENTAADFSSYIEAYAGGCQKSGRYGGGAAVQVGPMIDIRCRMYAIKPKTNLRVGGSPDINSAQTGCLIPYLTEGMLRFTIWKPISTGPVVTYETITIFLQDILPPAPWTNPVNGRREGNVFYHKTKFPEKVSRTTQAIPEPYVVINGMRTPDYINPNLKQDNPISVKITNNFIVFGDFPGIEW